MTARGYSINVTLIFSLARHREIARAYLRGLERLVAAGGDPARVHSVASFFVSRVDTDAARVYGDRSTHNRMRWHPGEYRYAANL
jgi:transaldolase